MTSVAKARLLLSSYDTPPIVASSYDIYIERVTSESWSVGRKFSFDTIRPGGSYIDGSRRLVEQLTIYQLELFLHDYDPVANNHVLESLEGKSKIGMMFEFPGATLDIHQTLQPEPYKSYILGIQSFFEAQASGSNIIGFSRIIGSAIYRIILRRIGISLHRIPLKILSVEYQNRSRIVDDRTVKILLEW